MTNGTPFTPIQQTYTVTGTDGNGCMRSDSMVLTVPNITGIDVQTACDSLLG